MDADIGRQIARLPQTMSKDTARRLVRALRKPAEAIALTLPATVRTMKVQAGLEAALSAHVSSLNAGVGLPTPQGDSMSTTGASYLAKTARDAVQTAKAKVATATDRLTGATNQVSDAADRITGVAAAMEKEAAELTAAAAELSNGGPKD